MQQYYRLKTHLAPETMNSKYLMETFNETIQRQSMEPKDLREQLDVRFRRRPPGLHKVEVRERRAKRRPVPEVVRPPSRARRGGHVPGGVLEVHGRDALERARDDRVGADLRPQVVRLPQDVGEDVERGVELLLPGGEAARELADGLEVARPEVVRVEHARGVERDVALVLEAGVPVDDLREVAPGDGDLLDELWIVAGGLDEGADLARDVVVQLPAAWVSLGGAEAVAAAHDLVQEVAEDALDLVLLASSVDLARRVVQYGQKKQVDEERALDAH